MKVCLSICFMTLLVIVQCKKVECGVMKKSHVLKFFIDTIPEEDRADFLTYQLIYAMAENNRTDITYFYDQCKNLLFKRFQDIPVPIGFSNNLLLWVEMLATDGYVDFDAVPQRTFCFRNGCINIGDIGGFCCPF